MAIAAKKGIAPKVKKSVVTAADLLKAIKASAKSGDGSPVSPEELDAYMALPPKERAKFEAMAATSEDKSHLWENDHTLVPRTKADLNGVEQMNVTVQKVMKRRAIRQAEVDAGAPQIAIPELPKGTPSAKAIATWKMANTLAKAMAKRTAYRWQFFDFLGPAKRESAGVVDIVAMRKSSAKPGNPVLRPYDLFDIILIQVKGGSAKSPSPNDIARLKEVKATYNASAIVLYEWQVKNKSRFLLLDEEAGEWNVRSAESLF